MLFMNPILQVQSIHNCSDPWSMVRRYLYCFAVIPFGTAKYHMYFKSKASSVTQNTSANDAKAGT